MLLPCDKTFQRCPDVGYRQEADFVSVSGVIRERSCGAVAPFPSICFDAGTQLTGICPSWKACNETACKCHPGSVCSPAHGCEVGVQHGQLPGSDQGNKDILTLLILA